MIPLIRLKKAFSVNATGRIKKIIGCLLIITSLILLFASTTAENQAQEKEPIAYVGHGGFFDQDGKQIELTAEFVGKAQDWYRAKLLSNLAEDKRTEFEEVENGLSASIKAESQARLIVQQHLLDWLLANSQYISSDGRTMGKLNALKYALLWKLPEGSGMKKFRYGEEFKIDPAIENKLKSPEFTPRGFHPGPLMPTPNVGQAYINECRAAGVPIPPPIGQLDPTGLSGWKSQGFIPNSDQFIIGTPAEVLTYQSSMPLGMCIALPRYTDDTKTTVGLDGVICLGQASSKVCFWDNQMNRVPFTFPAGTMIPIGVPDATIDPQGRYQAGGFELNNGSGGVCTDCHAGQNPYIIHPNSDLGGGLLMGNLNQPPLNLPTFSASRYDPLVSASWPQNQVSQCPAASVPGRCAACHVAGGSGGAFPRLSSELVGYCGTILAKAITRTMPPNAPGSLANDPGVIAFQNLCNSAFGTPIYIAHQHDGDVVMFDWKGCLVADLDFNRINNIPGVDLDFTPDDAIAIGDVNGDGVDEIVIAGNAHDRIDIFDKFGRLIRSFPADFNRNNRFAVGDVNGDGKAEILVAHNSDNNIVIWDGAGNRLGAFDHDFNANNGFAVGDVDGDGKAEVLVAHDHDHNIVIFELFFDQSGRRLVRTVVKADSPADFNTDNGFAVGNLDGEGGAEILVAHQSDHIIEIFALLPNGTFTSREIPTTFNTGNGFAVGDVDNDGEDEILVAHQHSHDIEVFDRDNTLKKDFDADFNPGNGFAVGHIDRDNNRDVTASLSTVRTGFRRDPRTGIYTQEVTLTNISANAISGPLWLVLDSLTNATLLNGAGVTENLAPLGSPFLSVEIGDNVLDRQESATAVLKFADPTNAGITYTTRVIAAAFHP